MKQQMTRIATVVALLLAASAMPVVVPVAAAADDTAKADDSKAPDKPADNVVNPDRKKTKKSKKACAVKGACSSEKPGSGGN